MLVIISDLHLTDGTSGATISAGAFEIFAERLKELALAASFRADGTYRPLERVDLVLLGDVLDVIRSARWSKASALRPWGAVDGDDYTAQIAQITNDILAHNEPSFSILRDLSAPGGLTLPPATSRGQAAPDAQGVPTPVYIHYMVGNHDWFFHLPGAPYARMRQAVVRQLGLANRTSAPFAHDPAEDGDLLDLMRRHKVFARHGDIYDPFNFEGDRNASSLGDAIVVELLNRFALAVEEQLGEDLPAACLLGLREIDNVNPLMLAPIWIDGLLERTCPLPALRKQVKTVWDTLVDQFLEVPFVRARDTWKPTDLVDGLERVLKFSKRVSIGWASQVIRMLQEIRGQSSESYSMHALAEQDFRNRRARHIVYGHTHHAESVPLDASHAEGYPHNQVYFNSGTWRRVHRQTELAPSEHEFIPSDVMTYLAFFQADERKGRPYETWSGTLGINPAGVPVHRVDLVRPRHANGQQVPSPAIHGLAPHFSGASTLRAAIVPRRRV